MEYLYVAGSSDISNKNKNLFQLISQQTTGLLYSLVNGMSKKNLGAIPMTDVANKINNCRNLFNNGKLFVDSGGYSIIKGDIPIDTINFIIDCWAYYAKHARDKFDFLFSLDIPLSIEYDELNTKQKIYKYNKISLSVLVNLIKQFPELREKLIFVWQFKMLSQYEIWRKLYDELELSKHIKHRAIGGMVGLRKLNKSLNFSPFTGMVFRCLLDFINSENNRGEFRLHFLGINIKYDRFHIALLERLCAHYLGNEITAKFSYDSINFAHTARKKKDLSFYSIEYDTIVQYRDITSVPDEVLKNVYGEYNLYTYIKSEIQLRKNNKNIKNIFSFAPLNIHSNMTLDRYFEKVIDEHSLVDIIINNESITTVLGLLHPILEELSNKLPEVFTQEVKESINKNIRITHSLHKLFVKKLYSDLDNYIKYLIKRMVIKDIII